MNDVEVLRTIEEIRNLQARYARFADEKRWADLASLFTEKASFISLDTTGNTVVEMVGRPQIEETLTAANVGEATLIHQLFSAEIEILTPSTATAVWAMADIIFREGEVTAQTGPDLPPFRTMRGWGHYHNRYERLDAGWLIADCRQTRTRLDFE